MLADVATHVHEWWGPVLAFVAGVVSFASPCVLPLVPGYLAFVSGSAGAEPDRARRGVGSGAHDRSDDDAESLGGGSRGSGAGGGDPTARGGAVAVKEGRQAGGRGSVLPIVLF